MFTVRLSRLLAIPPEPPLCTLQASTRCEQEGGKWGEAKTNSAKRGAAQRADSGRAGLQLQLPALPAEGVSSEATAAVMLRQMHSGRNRASMHGQVQHGVNLTGFYQ